MKTTTPSVPETSEATSPPLFGPGTLSAALVAEADGRGHVEFSAGRPVWVPRFPPRFPVVVEVTP